MNAGVWSKGCFRVQAILGFWIVAIPRRNDVSYTAEFIAKSLK
jgi:hypothetical protein